MKYGFGIYGYIINNVLFDCDRCLESFCKKNKIKTDLILINDPRMVINGKYEIIYFSDQEDSIDLKNILLEILFVEIPLKKLCTSLCKGLCSKCGLNLNHKVCSCSN